MLAEKLFKVSHLICSLNGIKCTLTEVQQNTKVLCIAFCLEQTCARLQKQHTKAS